METVEILLKDPPSWAAIAVFLAGLTALFWSLAGLKSHSPAGFQPAPPAAPGAPSSGMDKKPSKPSLPDPDATVNLSGPSFAAGVKPSAPPPPPPTAAITAVEEKFSELAKRVATLEHPKPGQVPSYLDPLLKRVGEVEGELKTLKFAFTQLAAAQNAINVGEITAKIQSIQKLLETLTGGTDVSKPS
jgi:hypothetical protein